MSSDPYRHARWDARQTKWVCKYCGGKGCLTCGGQPFILPEPAPPDEPEKLITHPYYDPEGYGACKFQEDDPVLGKFICAKRKEVHHLIQVMTYEELADTTSEAFQIFKALWGREEILHAMGPSGGGYAELERNANAVRARFAKQREENP